MFIVRGLKGRITYVLGPVLGLLIFAYFIYHSIEGDRGLLAWRNVNLRIGEAELRLSELEKERRELEARVLRLHPQSLDVDLIEEQGRRLLSFSYENELIILFDKMDKNS